MADNSDDAYRKALDSVQKILNAQKDLNKQTKSFESMWSSISSQVFALDGAEFFTEVRKSPEELRKIRDEIGQMKDQFDTLGAAFGQALDKNKEAKQLQNSIQDAFMHAQKSAKSFSLEYNNNLKEQFALIKSQGGELSKIITSESKLKDVLSGKLKLDKKQMDQLQKTEIFLKLQNSYQKKEEVFQKTVEKIWDKRIKTNQKLANFNKEAYQSITEQLAAGKSYEEISKTATGDAKMLLAELAGGNKEIFEMANAMEGLAAQAEKTQKSAGEMNKKFNLVSGALGAITKKFKADLIGSITQFDDVIHDVQKNTGIMMDSFANSKAFGDLTTYASQFGVSVEQAGQMMSDMSKQLNTTNFGVLSQAAKDFAVIEGATGAASEDITNIAGEMMRMGASSLQVRNSMEEADQMARQFGVSSNKVINGISRNIKKMREMGFTGGEKSLAKMAVTAERLRMNMDETFDMAKRARTIEGAMDMAAELQLAGGSFANINPMDLLSAARKGPEELQKILTKMGKDIGHFDKTTGEFKFDQVDVDRLQMVSDATGQSMESLQNMIQKNAEDTEKLNPFTALIDGMDEAHKEMAKSGLSQMLKMGEGGKIEFDAGSDMAKKMGIESMEQLQQMSSTDLKEKMDDNKKTLEQENLRNQSLKKSFDNFMKAVMSLGTILEPVLSGLTWFIQQITSAFTAVASWGNGWGKYILAGLVSFGLLFGTNVGLLVGKFLSGFMGTAKNMIGAITNPKQALGGLMDKLKGGKGTMEVPGKEISEQKGMTKGAGEGIKGFFTGLAEGIRAFGNIKMGDLLKFAASLAIIGGAIIGFTYALAAAGGEASIGQWLNAVGALVILGGSVWLMSKIFGQVDLGNIAKGALAMLLIGASLIPFAFAAQMMTTVDWGSVLKGVGVMMLVMVGLFALGLIAMSVGFIILAGAGLLAAAGLALMVAAQGLLMTSDAFNALGSVDWGAFSAMGGALLSVIPGMLGFAFASLLFANPLSLLGLMMMTSVLGGLVAVMAPLAMSLNLGADSLDRFASGLEKLGAAADKLSVDKLEELKELSNIMANASAGGAAMAAMANVANTAGGAGGGAGEVRKIEVDVKMNGRSLQEFIVKDTAIIK